MPFMKYMTAIVLWNNHTYLCQYGCQKKRWDLRNKFEEHKDYTKVVLGLEIEISYFVIFPLYFLEFPLYNWDLLRADLLKEHPGI